MTPICPSYIRLILRDKESLKDKASYFVLFAPLGSLGLSTDERQRYRQPVTNKQQPYNPTITIAHAIT